MLNPLNDQTATVGVEFSMIIPMKTFKDFNGDPLKITVSQSREKPLPGWLKWDPETLSLSGTPGSFDTDTYADREHTIDVYASDGFSSVKTSFTLYVQGSSFWENFIKYGLSFSSLAVSGLGLWQGRAFIWNHYSKDNYDRKGIERAVVVHTAYSYKVDQKRGIFG